MSVLDFYVHLTQLEVPIFTATPGGEEFNRPTNWQTSSAAVNDTVIKGKTSSDAICGVMGGLVAAVDVDPRNGGDVAAVRLLLSSLGVTVFAEVATPGGGRHFYVAGHATLASVHARDGHPGLVGYPGVDVQSFGTNVFLPGTKRLKYNGKGYRIVLDNLEALADGGDPDGADAFAGWVAEHRTSRTVEFTPSPPWDGTPPDARQMKYLAAVLTNQVEEISAMAPDSGRNSAVYLAALKCGNFVAGAGMNEPDVIDQLTQAAYACALVADDGIRSVEATIRSGLRFGRTRPRAVPSSAGGPDRPPADVDADGRMVPIPLDRIDPLPPFPIAAIPDPVRAMVEAVAEFTQTDTALPGTVAIGVLSACAAGRVKVEVRGSWTEPLCVYCAVSSAPGTRKSPVFSAMTAPLVVAEQELVDVWRPKALDARTHKQIANESARNKERAAASPKGDNDAVAEAISAAMFAESIEIPTQPRIMADDVTAEALAALLAAHGGRIAIMSAEGGIFDTLAGRYSNGVPNLDTMLKGWSAEPVRVDRRGAPSEYVKNACITMMLTIQPSVLSAIARNDTFRGRGLLARFLFSLPPNNVGHRRVGMAPISDTVSAEYDRFVRKLAVDLEGWASDPATLMISPEAARLLLDLEAKLEPRLGPEGDLAVIADWGSKAVGQTIRLAGLLHLVHGESALQTSIDVSTMRAAISLIEYYTAHAKAAFVAMGTDETTVDAMFVLDHLRREHVEEFTVRGLHVKLGTSRFRKADDLKAALDTLEDNYWISRKPVAEHPGPGRKPSPTYVTQFTESTESRSSVDYVSSVTKDRSP